MKTKGTIELRPTSLADLDFVLTSESHPENAEYVYQWERSQHSAALSNPNLAHRLIYDCSSRQNVGYVILDDLDNHSRSINLRRLVVTQKGRGIGTSALKLIKELAFIHFKAHRLWLDVFSDNPRAYLLYQKLGFKQEGLLRESYLRPSGYASQFIMAMLAAEYSRELAHDQ